MRCLFGGAEPIGARGTARQAPTGARVVTDRKGLSGPPPELRLGVPPSRFARDHRPVGG
ncbi:hypothetical protein SBRY_110206 [Actinacidiphila bryophytorum]|uniref:Uncharacterized protein n=1 Tax=Actinacidiphila bryophytorum TaxID=1436133 RepID=A0A9W4E840_9ACTN|nr:hypothetical protein SBRY_110206 [Actinacidiphila bryophytorum]